MAKVDAFQFEGKRFDRTSFRALLESRIKAVRDDEKSPYRDGAHPDHAAAVRDVNDAYRWLAGEVNADEEYQLAATVNEAMRGGQTEVANELRPELQGLHRMNEIAGTRDGREALQRAKTGQELSPAQAALVNEYQALEREHNAAAKPAYTGGTFSTKRPHAIPRELFDLERISDKRERLFAIRQLKSEWRDNPQSAFNDAKNPEHHNHVLAMQRLYSAEQELGPQPEDAE